MTRTAGAATDTKKQTIAFWIKRNKLGAQQYIIDAWASGGQDGFYFSASDTLNLNFCNGSTGGTVPGVFRDPAAWWHVCVNLDTTQAAASARIRYWINGVEGSTSGWTFPTLNATTNKILNAQAFCVAKDMFLTAYSSFQMCDLVIVDGTCYDYSYFIQKDATTGQWGPKTITGLTYGAQGGYYPMTNNSTAATLGTDMSGNGNTLTVTNVSVAADATLDSLVDTPTDYGTDTGAGGEVRGNYCTLNPLDYASGPAPADGNLKMTGSASAVHGAARMTMALPATGKWIAECLTFGTITGGNYYFGLWATEKAFSGQSDINTGYNKLAISDNGTNVSSGYSGTIAIDAGFSIATGQTIHFEYDADSATFAVRNKTTGKNVVWTSIAAQTVPQHFVFMAGWSAGTANGVNWNFGQRAWASTPTSGFKALCTQNLPTPAVPKPETRFLAIPYLGNGGNQFVGDDAVVPLDSYAINNGLRFQRANTTYMTRTPGVAGNRQKFTLSFWCKRSLLTQSNDSYLFGAGTAGAAQNLGFSQTQGGGDCLFFQDTNATWCLVSNQKFRDVQNWHHFVFAVDTTQATATNRIRVYYDGVEITSWATDNRATSIAQNSSLSWTNNVVHALGAYSGNTGSVATYNPDVYMAQVALVDGQQLTPSSFGQSDANGNWIPKDVTTGITWGTTGSLLTFSNSSSVANLGLDSSGNGNTWTPSGFSVTAGTAFDPLLDAPAKWGTDTGAGNEVHGNYCTYNPLMAGGNTSAPPTLSAGNLLATGVGTGYHSAAASIPLSTGKWYVEFQVTPGGVNLSAVGMAAAGWGGFASTNSAVGSSATSIGFFDSGDFSKDGTLIASAALPYTGTDIIGLAVDFDAGKFWMRKNGGAWYGGGNPATGTLPSTVFALGLSWYFTTSHSGASSNGWMNAGQRAFANAAPSGFKAICSQNLPADTQVVNTPDLVIIKSRSAATGWAVADSVNGAGKYRDTTSTGVQTTDINSIANFNFNGIYIGNASILNTLNSTYVAYMWDKNAACGIDIVTFTGNGGSQTFGHSLGKAPSMMICKNTSGSAQDWIVYHSSIGNTGALALNTALATNTSINWWSNVTPGAATFSVGANFAASTTYVNYLFAEVPGFSKFGSFTGNGLSDGVFLNCGFRPRFVLIKGYTTGSSWVVYDTARNTVNQLDLYMNPETTAAETTTAGYVLDFVSNGVKLRGNGGNINNAAVTYIYAAFAEAPFKYARAR